MGLDMYLYAQLAFKPDSDARRLFDEHTTDEEKVAARNPEEGHYVSGWTWPGRDEMPGRDPEPLYTALADLMGVEADAGSPHFTIKFNERGEMLVDACIFYWRKANAIHNWFVTHVQDEVDECEPHEVHPELIADLIDRCERVTVDHDCAKDLLPPQGGFFFGSTDLDDYYFEDIKDTAVNLKAVLQAVMPLSPTLIYCSSW